MLKRFKVRFHDGYYHKAGEIETVYALNKEQADLFARLIRVHLRLANNDWLHSIDYEILDK